MKETSLAGVSPRSYPVGPSSGVGRRRRGKSNAWFWEAENRKEGQNEGRPINPPPSFFSFLSLSFFLSGSRTSLPVAPASPLKSRSLHHLLFFLVVEASRDGASFGSIPPRGLSSRLAFVVALQHFPPPPLLLSQTTKLTYLPLYLRFLQTHLVRTHRSSSSETDRLEPYGFATGILPFRLERRSVRCSVELERDRSGLGRGW